MFRVNAKIWKDNHIMKDCIIEEPAQSLSRTAKVFDALEKVCYEFDLQKPLWLNLNIKDFKKYSKTRFTEDSFLETISFDYLEFLVIEE